MVNNSYKSKVKDLIAKAKSKNLVSNYSTFCKTNVAKTHALSEEEINYYTSKNSEGAKLKSITLETLFL